MSYDLPLIGSHLLDRRRFFSTLSTGLGAAALVSLLAEEGALARSDQTDPLAPKPVHFRPRAKRVLQIFCSGAVSHLDTWDYKPELVKRHGAPMPGSEKLITFQGENGNLTKSPWEFKPRGESGKMISELLPHLAEHADDLCFLHGMTSKTNTHGPGEMFMNTGFTLEGFPSAGAWVAYALGSECRDLPAYVAIPDPRGVPQQGPANWGNGFLPAVYQGTAFNAERPIRNLQRPSGIDESVDRSTREFLQMLNHEHEKRNPEDTELSARIRSYELAARMQVSAPEVSDLSGESAATRKLYGIDSRNPLTAAFGRNCLLARRLLERGVRFVSLYNGAFAMGEGALNWDGHKRIKEDYDRHGPILDQPAAGLLTDLRARGLLDDTVVLWSTEFGRMPTFQKGTNGRDHNPKGFTAWLTGAGVKRGFSYGATDEFGHQAVENPTSVHELYATILHLLGIDFRKLSYRHNGADRRLTDVHGKVIEAILS
ncbi:MAG: DUF1501 domain-containing protein [Isosphaeraceae bacterium]|nr:DUF1501 domain-containing protein [Isosphaeraceae bacterium]